jgi:hypothetical protein
MTVRLAATARLRQSEKDAVSCSPKNSRVKSDDLFKPLDREHQIDDPEYPISAYRMLTVGPGGLKVFH